MQRGLTHIFLLLVLLWSTPLRAELVINELMQSNIDCVMDDRNEFPDSWVELYNPSSETVSLQTYAIAPSTQPSERYNLPNVKVAGHGTVLIYCDKENTGLHTSFRLESGKGGEVHLYHNGVEVDAVRNLAKQPAPNIAYGRAPGGLNNWGYQQEPTPNAPNTGLATHGLLPEPVFNLPSQVLMGASSARITMTLPAGVPAGTVIRYTTDGTEPTGTNGTVASGTLVINKTKVIRAKLFYPGYLSPRSTTRSYLFLDHQTTMPVVSIVTDPAYLTDPAIGIYTAGNQADGSPNYRHNWRRPLNIEYFPDPNGTSVLNQLCEGRIQGGASRDLTLKSWALYANKRFGAKRFEYEFFPDQRPGQTNFKSLLLRNAGNDFDYLYMRDAIMQRSMATYQDLDWQAWRPAIVFINGVYKGIENIRERSNDDNIFTNYNELEDITMMENGWDLKAGTWQEWSNFQTFYSAHGQSWQEWQEMVDCTEYINLMILNLFYNNQDFPANNIVYWKPNVASDTLPARWRFIAKDTDFGLGLYGNPANYETFTWFYTPGYDANHDWGNSSDGTRLFRRAMENASFRKEFVDRSALYIGDFLNLDAVWPMWEEMYEEIREEYPHHRKLYNQWWPNYQNELSSAKQWLRERPNYYLNQLRNQYSLGALMQLSINDELPATVQEGLGLTVSGVRISRGAWDGQFFADRSIVLQATPQPGAFLRINGWEVRYTENGKIRAERQMVNPCVVSIPANCTRVSAQAIVTTTTGFDDVPALDQADKRIEDGQLIIYRHGHRYTSLGILID